jgi:hypothetical protein
MGKRCTASRLQRRCPGLSGGCGAAGEYDTFTQCCQLGWNHTETETIRGDGINNFECYIALNATLPSNETVSSSADTSLPDRRPALCPQMRLL